MTSPKQTGSDKRSTKNNMISFDNLIFGILFIIIASKAVFSEGTDDHKFEELEFNIKNTILSEVNTLQTSLNLMNTLIHTLLLREKDHHQFEELPFDIENKILSEVVTLQRSLNEMNTSIHTLLLKEKEHCDAKMNFSPLVLREISSEIGSIKKLINITEHYDAAEYLASLVTKEISIQMENLKELLNITERKVVTTASNKSLSIGQTFLNATYVPNFLPSDVNECLLAEYKMVKENSISGCLGLCHHEENCLLACNAGRICRLYDATVSKFYSKRLDVSEELSTFNCLSLWDDELNIAPYATYTHSSAYKGLVSKNVALGYSCPSASRYNFHSNDRSNSWLLADFGSPVKVKKVIIQLRGNSPYGLHFFHVEVRVGNSSDAKNKENPLLMSFNERPKPKQIVTFEGAEPIIGRYVSVREISGHSLVIMEMKIISMP